MLDREGSDQAVSDAVTAALDARRLLVSGPHRVGRTTFAKRIVSASRARGETPVYARGDVFHHDFRPEAVARRIAALAAEQYEGRVVPDVLVLDDLDRARMAGEAGARAVGRRDVLHAVEDRFERVVAFTTQYDLAAIVNADERLAYDRAALGSFGPERRAELAGRFVEAVAPVETWRAFVGPVRRILETLFGTSRVPSFPYYILVALGELYTGDPAHIDGTAYGPYYEVVVHEAAEAARAHRSRRAGN